MTLEAIKYCRPELKILDQLQLPHESIYIHIKSTKEAWNAIKKMQIRGAPGIAIVGALSIAVEIISNELQFNNKDDLLEYIKSAFDFLITARPTAVNITDMKKKAIRQIQHDLQHLDFQEMYNRFVIWLESQLEIDIKLNKTMSQFGADYLINLHRRKSQECSGDKQLSSKTRLCIMTHCNTGSLATAGYGTALGVIRNLHFTGRLTKAYPTETRPYNQGARLTAYELQVEKIPFALICDNMVASAIVQHQVDAIVVGADRIVSNGDTANKIGTFQLAILAKYFAIPFMVVAPTTSFDFTKNSGRDIIVEERPSHEMTQIAGIQIAPHGIEAWNPAFDITPSELITGGIATEFGVFNPDELKDKLFPLLQHDNC